MAFGILDNLSERNSYGIIFVEKFRKNSQFITLKSIAIAIAIISSILFRSERRSKRSRTPKSRDRSYSRDRSRDRRDRSRGRGRDSSRDRRPTKSYNERNGSYIH